MYATVGLAVGYFSYRRGLNNLLISSVFRPVFGDRVDGPVGKTIDILAIMATLFGVAVSLGLGTLQIDAGLNQSFGTPTGTGTQLAIIAVTAVAYMLSASTPGALRGRYPAPGRESVTPRCDLATERLRGRRPRRRAARARG